MSVYVVKVRWKLIACPLESMRAARGGRGLIFRVVEMVLLLTRFSLYLEGRAHTPFLTTKL